MEQFLSGANVAMVIVTLVLVQLIKFFLPPVPPAVPGEPVNKWSVGERWKWIPFYAAFLIAVILSIIFDPHAGQTLRYKISDGLQTGAYTVVTWEVYSNTFQRVIDRLRGL
jgi:hypothetical protein